MPPDTTPSNAEQEAEKQEMAPNLRTARINEDANAHSQSVTIADGPETFGVLNQHSPHNTAYQVGLSDDRGARRTMEDAHSFVVDFGGVKGQGFFAIFDGHAGKHAAEWCGAHFHEHLLQVLKHKQPGTAIPDALNQTFHNVDKHLSDIAAESDGKMHSGCTAVTAFVRIEDENGEQPWMAGSPPTVENEPTDEPMGTSAAERDSGSESPSPSPSGSGSGGKKKKSSSRIVSAIRDVLRSPSPSQSGTGTSPQRDNGNGSGGTPRRSTSPPGMTHTSVVTPTSTSGKPLRRVLYTANAGDARGVLCRNGKAVRLTYDHKGSDKQEAKRIIDAGGFVMSGRVNGVLAVTRSLGDASMKEFVVGAPFTTETDIGEDDEFLILACDGLWDVAEDQTAVDLVRNIDDAQEMSKALLQHALDKYTNDNVTVLVVRFRHGEAVAK